MLLGAVALAAAACGGQPFESAVPSTGPEATTSSSISEATTSSSVVEPTVVTTASEAPPTSAASLPLSAEPTGATLPDGITRADLPDEPGERLNLMTDWLEDTYPTRSSGHAYSAFDGVYDLTFNINIGDEAEARALCPFFTELAGLYLWDTEHSISLNGWVITGEGYFEEAAWDRFAC